MLEHPSLINSGSHPTLVELPYYKHYLRVTHPPPVSIADVAPQIDRLGISLLSQMLTFDPLQRCSATDAIKHAYFSSDVLQGPPTT